MAQFLRNQKRVVQCFCPLLLLSVAFCPTLLMNTHSLDGEIYVKQKTFSTNTYGIKFHNANDHFGNFYNNGVKLKRYRRTIDNDRTP